MKSPISGRLAAASTVAALGVFILVAPSVASAATSTTVVSSVIGSIISAFTSTAQVNIDATPSAVGVQTTQSGTVTVSTNDSNGYTLQIEENAASNNLVSGADNIPGGAGTFASPQALTANTWGYRVDGVGTFGAGPTTSLTSGAIGAVTYAKVPALASPDTIKSTSSTATNDVTTIWYSVAVNTSTPSGTYTNTVKYTALGK